jgi:hypothetical protein
MGLVPHDRMPADLGHAFTVRQARAHGISSGRLQAKHLSAPYHGTRARHALSDRERLSLLLDALPPPAVACGPTAAALHEMPLPLALELRAFSEPTIGVPLPANRIRRPGVVGRALALSEDEITRVDGIRCTLPGRTWIDVAPLVSLPRLIAITDHLISRRRRVTTLAALQEAHRRAEANRGSAARSKALALCSDGSESPRESETRAILVLAGLPMPQVNVEIFDGTRFVARVDLLYREARLIIEYDGDYHRTPGQWSRDQSRRAELESLGYRVTVVTARDLEDPAALVARIERLLAA